ncbi:MAG: hypothetical protein JSW11_21005 [Candidatus Heimdallarchaeota archaeon]|nr:MAG: hypothetical protein JSW11_21005 [Candidatus Heimdallarchaeota archaeon]
MSNQSVHAYIPSPDGEYIPIKFTSPEKDLKKSEVIIFLDEESRQIFIWTGSESSVRKRFISSQIARQMRLERGMTHRISTEDQGNETSKFWEFMNGLNDRGITASTLLEVSPPTISSDLPEPEPREIVTHPATLKKVASVKAVTPAKTKVAPPKPETKPHPAPIEPVEYEVEYFCEEVTTAIPEAKAKIIFEATNKDLILTTLHISTAATEGRIGLYSIPKKGKTVSVKSTKAIFAIYLQEGSPILELDDLYIPIPSDDSIYFTCPANTFISINLES